MGEGSRVYTGANTRGRFLASGEISLVKNVSFASSVTAQESIHLRALEHV